MTPEPRFPMACAALALLLALLGCNGEKRQATAGTAGGEILEASVSDSMLPIDQVRSQAPLAPHTEAAKGTRQAKGDDAEEGTPAVQQEVSGDQGAGAAEAPPAPATPSEE